MPLLLVLVALYGVCAQEGPTIDVHFNTQSTDDTPLQAASMCPNPCFDVPETLCSNRFVNLNFNNDHCGSCNNLCPDGQECVAGTCFNVITVNSCPQAGHVTCDGFCTDIRTDESNCGSCGATCDAGLVCNAGACVCEAQGTTICDGQCRDVFADAQNCGECGLTCTGNTPFCFGGVCTCADILSDNDNCGGCGLQCPADSDCTAGACVCESEEHQLCGDCVNTEEDTANCGECGKACPLDTATCIDGACVCDEESETVCKQTDGSTVCVDLDTNKSFCGSCDSFCPNNVECADGECSSCPSGLVLCSGVCLDFDDRRSCGSCSTECGATLDCVNQECVPVGCDDDAEICGDKCVEVDSDTQHCSSCDSPCGDGGRGQLCQAGSCSCPPDYTTCGVVCVNTDTNPQNCGSCGFSCNDGGCVDGQCVGTCSTEDGQGLCDGVCIDLNTDYRHCGACGATYKGAVCIDGEPVCSDGREVCPISFIQNACVDTQIESTHCGECGNRCRDGIRCINGQCSTTCASSAYSLCGSGDQIKCALLDHDKNHCGSCGIVCPGKELCESGECVSYEPFNIVFDFTDNIPENIQDWFLETADFWESAIVGDVPDVTVPTLTLKDEFVDYQYINYGEECPYYEFSDSSTTDVDDIVITVDARQIDGWGNAFGISGPALLRADSGLPIYAVIVLDIVDMLALGTALPLVIKREVGVALGFHFSVMSSTGLVEEWDNAPVDDETDQEHYLYTGPAAVRAFKKVGRVFSEDISAIPMVKFGINEDSEVSLFKWSEEALLHELFTPRVDSFAPVSIVTIGAFHDMGYTVDMSAAEPFSLASVTVDGHEHKGRRLSAFLSPPVFGFDNNGKVLQYSALLESVAARSTFKASKIQ